MTSRSSITGQAVAEAYDFGGVDRVVDVAGGRGKMLASILKAHPRLRGTLFDLPRVVETASDFLVTEGVADRCEIVSGDMFTSVPPGGDLYLLARVIHNWDDPRAIEILHSCRSAMGPKAKLLIIDRAMPERVEASPLVQSNALADLTMMISAGGGRERTAKQFEALVSATGLDSNASSRCPYWIASSKLRQYEDLPMTVPGPKRRFAASQSYVRSRG